MNLADAPLTPNEIRQALAALPYETRWQILDEFVVKDMTATGVQVVEDMKAESRRAAMCMEAMKGIPDGLLYPVGEMIRNEIQQATEQCAAILDGAAKRAQKEIEV